MRVTAAEQHKALPSHGSQQDVAEAGLDPPVLSVSALSEMHQFAGFRRRRHGMAGLVVAAFLLVNSAAGALFAAAQQHAKTAPIACAAPQM